MLVAPTCAEKHMGGLQKFLKMELAASWATTAFPKCHRPNRIAIIGLEKKREASNTWWFCFVPLKWGHSVYSNKQFSCFFFPVGMSHGSLALFPLVVMSWRASSFLDAYDVGWKKNRLQTQLNKKVSNWQNGLKTTERAIARVTNLHWTCLVHIDAAYVCLGPITLHAVVGVYPSVPAAWVDNQKSVLAVNFFKKRCC